MRWCNNDSGVADDRSPSTLAASSIGNKSQANITCCPSCGHRIQCEEVAGSILQELPGLPVGVKFDPSDMEILEHLELKTKPNAQDLLHPLIDTFIPTIEGDDGICYTHPEKLPGVGKDGLVRHFFHRPSKAYTTGTRKRRKILRTDVEDRGETRWHKTGKTRPVFARGSLKGHKKILVLYANCGRHRKPEKTNWVMHQYHLGSDEDEKNGELVVSKVFYQTQPRQNGVSALAARADEAVAPAVQYKGLTVHSRHDSASRNPYNNMLLGGHVDGGATASSPLLPSLSCVPLGHRFFVE